MDSKRSLDLILGSLLIVATAPILLAIAAAMRLSGDNGPFLYRARRMGEEGRIITVLKIRTMAVDAPGGPLTRTSDPRLTRLGRRIRRVHLDELPQLVNVVRGDMSLVGPRPEDPAFLDRGDPLHRRVFTAKPGITGLSQLKFRREAVLLGTDHAEQRYRDEILPAKLRVDADYLDRRTLRLDLEILLRTLKEVRP